MNVQYKEQSNKVTVENPIYAGIYRTLHVYLCCIAAL